MGEKSPPPITNMDRAAAVDVHQMRTGRWSGSAQFLHDIDRNPSSNCQQCRNTTCEAALCPLWDEEADEVPCGHLQVISEPLRLRPWDDRDEGSTKLGMVNWEESSKLLIPNTNYF